MVTTDSQTVRLPLVLILAAAGSSSRMHCGTKKEYLPMQNGTVLSQSARAFLQTEHFALVIVAIPAGHEAQARSAFFADGTVAELLADTPIQFVTGGATRQASVCHALEAASAALNQSDSLVLIHDAARPFVTGNLIKKVIHTAQHYGAAVPAVIPTDTQKKCNSDGTIQEHLVRSKLAAVQTPQVFLLQTLLSCHRLAAQQHIEYTDDSEIWDAFPETTGHSHVHVTAGESSNRKITYAEDIDLPGTRQHSMGQIRIGLGSDLHRLVEGRPLVIGGVTIPFEKGEAAHSDGDVLLHAITDAVLGASGLGDIGTYFPPEDPQWKNADSKTLLNIVWQDVRANGWQLCNLDCVLELERPAFSPHRDAVIASIANILDVPREQIFVKAKTNEGLGEIGASLAVKAYCSCLLTCPSPKSVSLRL
ncbi:MAG: 2-C-methyl-D-erythritol 2,4-cyclodiphosphate synthase [Treponema sp.]|nr:2-C-methyl-D-erythritol 2,4-cyclodiphosphate synthase [Treponema sp.]